MMCCRRNKHCTKSFGDSTLSSGAFACAFSLNYFLILRADSNRNICYVIGTLSSYMTGTESYHAGYTGQWGIFSMIQ